MVAKCTAQSSSNYISSQNSGLNKRCKRPALTPRSPLFRGSGPVSHFLTHNCPTRARRSEVMLGLPTAPCWGVLLQCAPGSSESHASAASTAKMELGGTHAQCKPVERERKKGGETPLLTSVGFQQLQAHGSMPLHHSCTSGVPVLRTAWPFWPFLSRRCKLIRLCTQSLSVICIHHIPRGITGGAQI